MNRQDLSTDCSRKNKPTGMKCSLSGFLMLLRPTCCCSKVCTNRYVNTSPLGCVFRGPQAWALEGAQLQSTIVVTSIAELQ